MTRVPAQHETPIRGQLQVEAVVEDDDISDLIETVRGLRVKVVEIDVRLTRLERSELYR